jgi:hypothetical protein
MVLSMMLAACAQQATPTATTPAPTAGANWWDELGEPTYGGELVWRGTGLDFVHMDPGVSLPGGQYVYYGEPLFSPGWATDPSVWPYDAGFVPVEYMAG